MSCRSAQNERAGMAITDGFQNGRVAENDGQSVFPVGSGTRPCNLRLLLAAHGRPEPGPGYFP